MIVPSKMNYTKLNSFKAFWSLILAAFLMAISALDSYSQSSEEDDDLYQYYNEKEVRYTDRVYDSNIKTVMLHIKGSELDAPIIPLNGSEKLILRFDDLSEDPREMHYSFTHCTWDWQPSDLLEMDYIEGFNDDIILNFDFSFNTVNNYTNYVLEFPNNRINLTRSGNYIIKVFADGDPDDVLLTGRFMVVEPNSSIAATVHPSNVVADRAYKQEVDVEVSLGNINTMNPYRDIQLVIMQNFRKDNVLTGIKPNFIKNNKLTYNYQGPMDFGGGNEFRFFDGKSLRYRSEEVEEIRNEEDGYHIYLAPDVGKAFKQYTFENDINGKFLVRNDDMIDPHLESDYVTVHFQFPVDAYLGNGDMYVLGQLSDWDLKRTHRMTFNADNLSYELELLLKQGYYNYTYAWKYNKQQTGTNDLTDGDHSETENDYLILIYFSDQSAFADRLIGVERINSLNSP